MNKNESKKIISLQRELTEIIAVSGNEFLLAELIRKKLTGKVDQIWSDNLGSLYGLIKGNSPKGGSKKQDTTGKRPKNGPSSVLKKRELKSFSPLQKKISTIMLDAHMDEVGFLISHITKNGFLNFVPIGCWDNRIFLGQAVKILSNKGKEFHGVIGSKPPHLMTREDQNRPISVKDLYIDLGFSTSKDVQKNGLGIGSPGTLYSPFMELPKGMIRGKAFDNRTGVNILLHLADYFSNSKAPVDLVFSFSVQEEVGLRGAGPAAFSLDPDVALVVENTTAGDVPGINESDCPAVVGKGPAITVADNSVLPSSLTNNRLVQNARRDKIPFQWKKPIFGGTNAGRIQQSGAGIPVSVVSVPCRYIHSPTSLLSVGDVHDTIRLIRAFIENPANA